MENKMLRFIPVSEGRYGKPKLKRPIELKGVRKSFVVDFVSDAGRCPCECYVHGNDLWINHHNYFFSYRWTPPEHDAGKPATYYMKKYFGMKKPDTFTYADNYCGVLLRSEAWIDLENMIPTLEYFTPQQIASRIWELLQEYYGWKAVKLNPDWEHFLEDVSREAASYVKKKSGGK